MKKQKAPAESDRKQKKFYQHVVVFSVGRRRFALPVSAVVEVFDLSSLPIKVPGVSDWMGGIINHHGQVLPLIQMNMLLGVESRNDTGQVLLVELFGDRLGILVDQIESLEEVEIEESEDKQKVESYLYHGEKLEKLDLGSLQKSIRSRINAGRHQFVTAAST